MVGYHCGACFRYEKNLKSFLAKMRLPAPPNVPQSVGIPASVLNQSTEGSGGEEKNNDEESLFIHEYLILMMEFMNYVSLEHSYIHFKIFSQQLNSGR